MIVVTTSCGVIDTIRGMGKCKDGTFNDKAFHVMGGRRTFWCRIGSKLNQ